MISRLQSICETNSMTLAQRKAAHDQLMAKATGR